MNLYFMVFLVVMALEVYAKEDFYKILGVSKDATERDIKKAYRELSKKYHPDKNPGDDESHQKFLEVGEAYEVLSDGEKRSLYDRFGHEALEGNRQQGGQNQQFNNIFNQFFGGARYAGHRGKPQGPDNEAYVELDLKHFYKGYDTDVYVDLQRVCRSCQGTGSADGKAHVCSECNGSGKKITVRNFGNGMIQKFQTRCGNCGGTGHMITSKCDKCNGAKVVRESVKFYVPVNAGAARNSRLVYEGESHQSPDWVPGNFVLTLRESEKGNLGYRRKGDNLFRTEFISVEEARKGGWSRSITFLDGESTIELSRKPGEVIQDGEVEIIKRYGMPKSGDNDEFGDLFIDYVIIMSGEKSGEMKDEL